MCCCEEKPRRSRDVGDLRVRIRQKLARVLEPPLDDELMHGMPGRTLELPAQRRDRQIDDLGELGDAQEARRDSLRYRRSAARNLASRARALGCVAQGPNALHRFGEGEAAPALRLRSRQRPRHGPLRCGRRQQDWRLSAKRCCRRCGSRRDQSVVAVHCLAKAAGYVKATKPPLTAPAQTATSPFRMKSDAERLEPHSDGPAPS